MIAAVLFLSFAILLLIGAPIAVCLGVSSVLAMLVQGAVLLIACAREDKRAKAEKDKQD